MLTVIFRTVFIYFFSTVMMRLSGKREIGTLQVGELVSVFLLSELAAIPIVDPDVPLLFALVPLLLLTILEIFISSLTFFFPKLKKQLFGTPSILIFKGKISEKALFDNRITVEELLSQLRLKGVSDISDADYVFLEENGQLSVILKKEKQPLSFEDVFSSPDFSEKISESSEKREENSGKTKEEPSFSSGIFENIFSKGRGKGISHPLILSGQIDYSNLKLLSITKKELLDKLGSVKLKEVLLFTVNDEGEWNLYLKNRGKNGTK